MCKRRRQQTLSEIGEGEQGRRQPTTVTGEVYMIPHPDNASGILVSSRRGPATDLHICLPRVRLTMAQCRNGKEYT